MTIRNDTQLNSALIHMYDTQVKIEEQRDRADLAQRRLVLKLKQTEKTVSRLEKLIYYNVHRIPVLANIVRYLRDQIEMAHLEATEFRVERDIAWRKQAYFESYLDYLREKVEAYRGNLFAI